MMSLTRSNRKYNHNVISFRSSTEDEIARKQFFIVLFLVVTPAQADIQERESMDTGFRRYDGTFVFFVAPIVPAGILEEPRENAKVEP